MVSRPLNLWYFKAYFVQGCVWLKFWENVETLPEFSFFYPTLCLLIVNILHHIPWQVFSELSVYIVYPGCVGCGRHWEPLYTIILLLSLSFVCCLLVCCFYQNNVQYPCSSMSYLSSRQLLVLSMVGVHEFKVISTWHTCSNLLVL